MAAELTLRDLNAQLEQEAKEKNEKIKDVEKRAREERDPDYIFRVLLIGDSKVGKTCLRHRCVNHKFLDTVPKPRKKKPNDLKKYVPLVFDYDPALVQLDIWDTNGVEGLDDTFYAQMDGVIFVYDVTNIKSAQILFQQIKEILDIKNDIFRMLIGNKHDLIPGQVSTSTDDERLRTAVADTAVFVDERIERLLGQCPVFQTSAKTGHNVEKAFEQFANIMLQLKKNNALFAANPDEGKHQPGAAGGPVHSITPSRTNTFVELNPVPYDHLFTVVVVGANRAGKSCLIKRYITNQYNDQYISTLGQDFFIKNLRLTQNGKPLTVKLKIYDTTPHDMVIPGAYYKEANGYIIVFDPASETGTQSIADWVDLIQQKGKQDAPRVLVAAKADISIARADAAEIWSNYKAKDEPPIIIVSAKANRDVDEPFFRLTEMLLKRSKPPVVLNTRRSASVDTVIAFSSALLRTQNAAVILATIFTPKPDTTILQEYMRFFDTQIRAAQVEIYGNNKFAMVDLSKRETSKTPRLLKYPYGAAPNNITHCKRFVCPVFAIRSTGLMAEFTHQPGNRHWPYKLTLHFIRIPPDMEEDGCVDEIIDTMLKSGDRLDGGKANRETNPFAILATKNYKEQVSIEVQQLRWSSITSMEEYIAAHKTWWNSFFESNGLDFKF